LPHLAILRRLAHADSSRKRANSNLNTEIVSEIPALIFFLSSFFYKGLQQHSAL
jgi:hypothetical protein